MKAERFVAWLITVSVWMCGAGCGPGVQVPGVHEPIDSPAWRECAGDLKRREARALIDDLTLDSRTLLCQGVALAAQGMTAEALDLLTEAGVRDKADHRPHYLAGRILAEAGRYEEALAAFERSAKRFPSMEVPSERIGRSIADKGDAEGARRFLSMARERGLCAYGCSGLLARLLHEAKQDEAAEAIYREMIEKTPDEPAAYVGLAALRNAAGRHAEEAELLSMAVSSARFADLGKSERADVLYGLAFAWYNAGRHVEAAQTMDKALDLSPKRADWHVLAGWIALAAGKPGDALGRFERARSLDPRLAAAHAGIGDALVAQGKPAEARIAFSRARDLEPTNAAHILKLAEATALAGDAAEARKLLAEAAAIDKDHMPPELVERVNRAIAQSASAAGEGDTKP